jgi:hypothetical protein
MKALRIGRHVLLALLLALLAWGYRGDWLTAGIGLLVVADVIYVIRLVRGPRVIRY